MNAATATATRDAGIAVEPVSGARDLELFARLPWRIYRNDPDWVPPLLTDFRKLFDPKKHPFYLHSECQPFVARRGGEVVGRIAAIWNRNHQKFHQEPVGFFGFFECVDDHGVAEALFAGAATWLRERGLTVMRGPASFSSNEEWGLLIDGWNGPPRVMMTYNPRYYPPLIESCGFAKAKDLVAYHFTGEGVPERLRRGTDIVAKRNPDVRIRSLDMKHFARELGIVRELYNRCWERNWGFVPMTEAEIDHMARELKPVVDPSLVLIMEKAGVPIGFADAAGCLRRSETRHRLPVRPDRALARAEDSHGASDARHRARTAARGLTRVLSAHHGDLLRQGIPGGEFSGCWKTTWPSKDGGLGASPHLPIYDRAAVDAASAHESPRHRSLGLSAATSWPGCMGASACARPPHEPACGFDPARVTPIGEM